MPVKISDLFTKYGSDKNTYHKYGPSYDLLVEKLPDDCHVLELGVQAGASLLAWKHRFPYGTVVGIDNNTVFPGAEHGVEVLIGDVTKADVLAALLGDRTFDLIVDDASHWEEHQLASFDILWPRVRKGGAYVVEDIQCTESHDKFRERGFSIIDLRAGTCPYRWDDVLAVRWRDGIESCAVSSMGGIAAGPQ